MMSTMISLFFLNVGLGDGEWKDAAAIGLEMLAMAARPNNRFAVENIAGSFLLSGVTHFLRAPALRVALLLLGLALGLVFSICRYITCIHKYYST